MKTTAPEGQPSVPPRFVLRDGSVGGEGMDPAIEAGGWPAMRALIYEGRGEVPFPAPTSDRR